MDEEILGSLDNLNGNIEEILSKLNDIESNSNNRDTQNVISDNLSANYDSFELYLKNIKDATDITNQKLDTIYGEFDNINDTSDTEDEQDNIQEDNTTESRPISLDLELNTFIEEFREALTVFDKFDELKQTLDSLDFLSDNNNENIDLNINDLQVKLGELSIDPNINLDELQAKLDELSVNPNINLDDLRIKLDELSIDPEININNIQDKLNELSVNPKINIDNLQEDILLNADIDLEGLREKLNSLRVDLNIDMETIKEQLDTIPIDFNIDIDELRNNLDNIDFSIDFDSQNLIESMSKISTISDNINSSLKSFNIDSLISNLNEASSIVEDINDFNTNINIEVSQESIDSIVEKLNNLDKDVEIFLPIEKLNEYKESLIELNSIELKEFDFSQFENQEFNITMSGFDEIDNRINTLDDNITKLKSELVNIDINADVKITTNKDMVINDIQESLLDANIEINPIINIDEQLDKIRSSFDELDVDVNSDIIEQPTLIEQSSDITYITEENINNLESNNEMIESAIRENNQLMLEMLEQMRNMKEVKTENTIIKPEDSGDDNFVGNITTDNNDGNSNESTLKGILEVLSNMYVVNNKTYKILMQTSLDKDDNII